MTKLQMLQGIAALALLAYVFYDRTQPDASPFWFGVLLTVNVALLVMRFRERRNANKDDHNGAL
ncbi:hypothetical protein [Shouchella shacheensis]|uniref:hypothetical protein n=1 Tax=Shouchella shacheensis TaxID=1649580 RepID=UPI0007400013|nr:hypothetical protein [Shouchella shacheensis]